MTAAKPFPDLPDPPVPADLDLRDFDRMPLDLTALFNSDTWRKAKRLPFAGFALINLWGRAWHQVPCGSLPDEEDLLQSVADVDDDAWVSIRSCVLRGFSPHSDGKLYHPVICSMGVDAAKAMKTRSRVAKRAANARWSHKKKHDARSNAEAMREQCASNAQAMLNPCSAYAKGREGKGRDVGKRPGRENGAFEPSAGDPLPKPPLGFSQVEVGDQCIETAKMDADPLRSYPQVAKWLRAGEAVWPKDDTGPVSRIGCLDRDVYQVIEAIAERESYETPNTLDYFTKPVLKAIAENNHTVEKQAKEAAFLKANPMVKPPPELTSSYDVQDWGDLYQWFENGFLHPLRERDPDGPRTQISKHVRALWDARLAQIRAQGIVFPTPKSP